MIIEENDFKLEFDDGCYRFDLYLLHIVNAKSDEKRREEFKLEGYSMTLTSAIRRIILYRLNKKLDVVSLENYLKEYKNEAERISSVFREYSLDKK